ELHADAFARLVDVVAVDDAVGPSEIDVLEDTEALAAAASKGLAAVQAGGIDGDELAGLDIAHELGADDVERAGLRRQDPGIGELADHQRAHAHGIAHADDAVLADRHQRIGTFDLAQRVDHALLDRVLEAG